jgi:hypothetical protein
VADGLSAANAQAALNAIVGVNAGFLQLHTGAPGPSGTANVSSVTTRPSVAWNAASGSGPASVTASNQPAWSSWAGTNGEVDTDISSWSASSAGSFGLSMALNASVTMNTGDSLTLTAITVNVPTAS